MATKFPIKVLVECWICRAGCRHETQKDALACRLKAPDADDMPVENLAISNRTKGRLAAENILTVNALLQKREIDLLMLPAFGRKSLNEIKDALAGLGLSLQS